MDCPYCHQRIWDTRLPVEASAFFDIGPEGQLDHYSGLFMHCIKPVDFVNCPTCGRTIEVELTKLHGQATLRLKGTK